MGSHGIGAGRRSRRRLVEPPTTVSTVTVALSGLLCRRTSISGERGERVEDENHEPGKPYFSANWFLGNDWNQDVEGES